MGLPTDAGTVPVHITGGSGACCLCGGCLRAISSFDWLFGAFFTRAILVLSVSCPPSVVVEDDDSEAMLSASLLLLDCDFGAIAAGFAWVGPGGDPVVEVVTEDVKSADLAALRGRVILVFDIGFLTQVAQWHTVIPNSSTNDAFRSGDGGTMRHAPQ